MTATEGRILAMTTTGEAMAQTTHDTGQETAQETIRLTETAAGEVQKLITEEGRPEIALRIAVQPGGCSGLRYAMYLDDQVSEKDLLEEQFGVKVVVDKMSVPYLTQATIDWVDSLEASGFTIDNPAAQSSCACGHSFH
jgi:iron-sulfur cluster assembly accessory protein